jgi:hypothetical protein
MTGEPRLPFFLCLLFHSFVIPSLFQFAFKAALNVGAGHAREHLFAGMARSYIRQNECRI